MITEISAATAAADIAEAEPALRKRTRILARGIGLCEGMNKAIGGKRSASNVSDLLEATKEQVVFLSIVLCSALLEADDNKRSFQYVYKRVAINGVAGELQKLSALACPNPAIETFIHFYRAIDWKVVGNLQHFRNLGIAHLGSIPLRSLLRMAV